MTDDAAIAILVAVLFVTSLSIWLLALAGEPQSLWLLRDILRVLP